MIFQRNCFSSVTVQLCHLHICLILTSHLCYFIFFCFFFFHSVDISMSLLLVSKNSFIIQDVNHLSCSANEVPYFIAINLLWCLLIKLCHLSASLGQSCQSCVYFTTFLKEPSYFSYAFEISCVFYTYSISQSGITTFQSFNIHI